jgi:hypothetical protein
MESHYWICTKDPLRKVGEVIIVLTMVALRTIFPEYSAAFSEPKVPKGYWDSKVNQKAFLDKVAQEFNITQYP